LKILFFSYTFAPNVGGIESVSATLAEKFAEAGHEVELVTETEENVQPAFARATAGRRPTSNIQRPIYRVTRKPPLIQLTSLLHWCDLLFQNNISLRSLIPALLMRKRAIVAHQTWLRDDRGGIGWNNRVKRALLRFVTNVAISEAIRDDINAPARVIGNPYDDKTFGLIPNIARNKMFVFVGRLVSDKGVDVLLQALRVLRDDSLQPDLTIIGAGPEEGNLRRLTSDLDLDRQVTFAGKKSGDELAEALNQHQIMVVPSRWAEPFGIVALEGIACGCVVVGSRGGGLPEAIGPCGLTFENGNAHELASCLKQLLIDPEKMAELRENADSHLARFRADTVVSAYLALIEET
jgi:glycogen(starch) synthase